MAKDLGDAIGSAVGRAAREAAHAVADNARKTSKNGSLSGAKGVAAGAGLAMLVPLAAKGAGKLAHGAKETVGKGLKDGVDKTVDKAGGAGGIAKKVGKDAIPGLGGDGDGGGGGQKNEAEGVGKGRRMPIQQSVDIGAPIATVYKEWTQYEEWPTFMHRLQNVSQEDDSHVSFKTKIWGISKEFNAEIVEEEPEQRIKWKVTDGVTHTGVVTFHEIADRLTHVEVNLDVDPGSLIEKAGRGMRHVKRAVRADLSRFKAYVMMQEDDSSSSSGRSSASSRSRSSASSRSKSSGSSSRSKSSGSGSRSKSSGSGSKSKSSGSSSRGRSSSSKGSSNGSSSGSSRRTTAKSRSSSSNGRSSGSRSGSSRKKSGSRS